MTSLVVEVDPVLRFLLAPRRRSGPFTVEAPASDTVGHVIRMVGIPPTEVGELRLDGHPADLSVRPTAGATGSGAAAVAADGARQARTSVLSVGPRSRPQLTRRTPPRFLLDVHLASLARRLRLLGLDVAWEPDAEDAHLVERAERETRVLLTRDRGLLHRAALTEGALVRGDGTEPQVDDVLDRFAPPLAPWTRCVRCNAPLRDAARAEVADELPPATRVGYDTFRRCTGCGQVFWRGAHAERLDAIVRRAQDRVRRAQDAAGRARDRPSG